MSDFADLELGLRRNENNNYSVEMRFTQPNSDADIRLGTGQPINVQIDIPNLQPLIVDPDEYGKTLSESVFADSNVATAFAQARTSAASLQTSLRLRLLIDPSAPELNTVYWETLRDPQDGSSLFTGERILFSRYLSSSDWRPVRLRSKGDLRALVAVSNPSDLANYKLAAVDVDGELARAKESLDNIPSAELGKAQACTLNELVECLRDGIDILYLVAHGTVANGESRIWLQGEDGKAAITAAGEIVTRIKELQNQPRLIVLASCQSAGKGAGDALQALGPKLATAGVPAVMAMQGNISMDSVKEFMPVFFKELQKDGQIDRALAVARGVVRDAQDYWMPVLFMRLRSGKIWYVPGFGEGGGGFEKWPAILGSLRRGQATPIVGPGLYEPLFGSWHEVAAHMADKYHFPLSPFFKDAFPQVAQYLIVNQDLNTLFNEIDDSIRVTLQRRFADVLSPEFKADAVDVQELLSAAGAELRKQDVNEQHRVLAGLPLPIYVTTNFDNLLAASLKEAGKDPQVVICPWSDRFLADSIYDTDPNYRPTVEQPLIYHLFGQFSVPDSLVLTEDDYFEYLIGVTSNKDLIPPAIRRALADTALLFLGFQLDDWSFRVFFRSVMGQQGGSRRSRYSHIGVQVDPDETRNIDPKRAHEYLERYFGDASINLYWGSSADFLTELNHQWKPAA